MYKIDNKKLRILLSFLICCFGLSLIHCRFHDWIDVIGATVFAFLEILLYHLISSRFEERVMATIALVASICFMLILYVILHKLPWYIWLAFYALAGTILSLRFIEDKKDLGLPQKFLSLATSAVLIVLIYLVFKILSFQSPFLSEIKFALFPIIAMVSANVCSRIKLRSAGF